MVDILHVLLFTGGVIGWGFLLYTLSHICRNRSKELEVINEIKNELKIAKDELQTLK